MDLRRCGHLGRAMIAVLLSMPAFAFTTSLLAQEPAQTAPAPDAGNPAAAANKDTAGNEMAGNEVPNDEASSKDTSSKDKANKDEGAGTAPDAPSQDAAAPPATAPQTTAAPEATAPAPAAPQTPDASTPQAAAPQTPAPASAPAAATPAPAPDAAAPQAAATPATTPAPDAAPQSAPQSATPTPAPDAAAPPAAPADTATPDAPAPQAKPTPDIPGAYTQTNTREPKPASRFDLYGGYSFLMPSGTVGIYSFQNAVEGYQISGTKYFTQHIGIQVDLGHNQKTLDGTGPAKAPPFVQLGNTTGCFYNAEAGPVYRMFVGSHLSPFVHVTGGGAKVGGPKFQHCEWGYGVTAGGGLDYIVPAFHRHVSLRVVQADYEYMHVDQGTLQPYDLSGGTDEVNALRLSAGLVIRFGEMNPSLEKSLICQANPSDVYAGERVVVAANANNYNLGSKYTFRWELSGGKVEGYGPAVFVNTEGMAAGTYTAIAHVSIAKKTHKQLAQCSARFTVKESPLPTIRCSANPTTVNPGEASMISSYVTSIPQRKLTFSYTASGGQINGSKETTELQTAGAPPGVITVGCQVKDDLGRTANATTEVTVSAPPLPPAPKAQKLCTLYFVRDQRRPARVDNEARACLDDIALTLHNQPDSRLVVLGEHDVNEPEGQLLAAERVINTRAYLSKEKGIDPSRIDIRTSATPGRDVETYLLAPGATWDQPIDEEVDETKVPIHGQQYARPITPRPFHGEGVSRPQH